MKAHWSAVLLLSALSGCAFHSTATQWHERVGPNGRPVYVKSTSNVGVNLFILVRLFGATNIDRMIGKMTEEIAKEGGDTVRIIQSSSENYWYGFPPFTWILTPVITTVAADYEPSAQALAENKAKQEKEE
jgi:hypothetical protein